MAFEHGAVGRFLSGLVLASAPFLRRLGLRPNMLTFASLVPAVASGIAAATGAFYVAAACLLLSAACDLFDGPLARATGTTSRFGALLDSTIDRLADAAPLLGLTVFYAALGWIAVVPALAILGGYTVSYVRARAEGLEIKLPPLWMRRPERIALTAVALLLADVGVLDLNVPGPLTLALVAVLAVLSLVASAHALWTAKQLTRSPAGEPQARQ